MIKSTRHACRYSMSVNIHVAKNCVEQYSESAEMYLGPLHSGDWVDTTGTTTIKSFLHSLSCWCESFTEARKKARAVKRPALKECDRILSEPVNVRIRY